jgi:hypothetical protein
VHDEEGTLVVMTCLYEGRGSGTKSKKMFVKSDVNIDMHAAGKEV